MSVFQRWQNLSQDAATAGAIINLMCMSPPSPHFLKRSEGKVLTRLVQGPMSQPQRCWRAAWWSGEGCGVLLKEARPVAVCQLGRWRWRWTQMDGQRYGQGEVDGARVTGQR